MSYRKGESNKDISDIERANDDSSMRIYTSVGKTRISQTGAASEPCRNRHGVLGSYNDNPAIIDSKVGKARKTEDNPTK